MAKRQEEWGNYRLRDAICDYLDGGLYHLTDWAHVDSIKKHGLLSRCEADARGVEPARPGGNGLTRALEDQRALQDYVFLSLHETGLMPNNNDLDSWRRPLMLYIDPEIVVQPGVKLSLGRSTRSDILNAKLAFYRMDWDIFANPELRSDFSSGSNGPARWNTFLDYEVLVPKCVPIDLIIGSDG